MSKVIQANKVFLVMGLEKTKNENASDGFVMFCGVVAENQARAGALFLEKHANFELMSVTALSEMQDAVKLLTYIQEGRDKSDPDFPVKVYRDGEEVVDAGQFGL